MRAAAGIRWRGGQSDCLAISGALRCAFSFLALLVSPAAEAEDGAITADFALRQAGSARLAFNLGRIGLRSWHR
jgi:hypothetical protein